MDCLKKFNARRKLKVICTLSYPGCCSVLGGVCGGWVLSGETQGLCGFALGCTQCDTEQGSCRLLT